MASPIVFMDNSISMKCLFEVVFRHKCPEFSELSVCQFNNISNFISFANMYDKKIYSGRYIICFVDMDNCITYLTSKYRCYAYKDSLDNKDEFSIEEAEEIQHFLTNRCIKEKSKLE